MALTPSAVALEDTALRIPEALSRATPRERHVDEARSVGAKEPI